MDYELTFDVLWQTRKYIPFLEREVLVRFISEEGDQQPTSRQIAIADSLHLLAHELPQALTVWARTSFQAQLDQWGLTSEELCAEIGIKINKQSIQNHFEIDEVIIPRINQCKENYIFLCGCCDWDGEHGIEFLLKDGTPIQCTSQDGLAFSEAWDIYLAQK
jgi:hypothetical protein